MMGPLVNISLQTNRSHLSLVPLNQYINFSKYRSQPFEEDISRPVIYKVRNTRYIGNSSDELRLSHHVFVGIYYTFVYLRGHHGYFEINFLTLSRSKPGTCHQTVGDKTP